MQSKVCGFDENDMKTHSCRQGLSHEVVGGRRREGVENFASRL